MALVNDDNSFNRPAIFAHAWASATKWASTPARRRMILGLWLKDAWRRAREQRAQRLADLAQFPYTFASAVLEGIHPMPTRVLITSPIAGSTTDERILDHEAKVHSAMAAHRRAVVAMVFGR